MPTFAGVVVVEVVLVVTVVEVLGTVVAVDGTVTVDSDVGSGPAPAPHPVNRAAVSVIAANRRRLTLPRMPADAV